MAGGFLAAFAVAVVAVMIREHLTDGPDAQASSGMYAAGDMFLGIAVFGLLSLAPLALGLYWLRPVARFWAVLVWLAGLLAVTGPLAVLVSGWLRQPAGNWAFLADLRVILMPLVALAMATTGLFAPQPRARWVLIGAAVVEGSIFAGVVLVKFVLSPH